MKYLKIFILFCLVCIAKQEVTLNSTDVIVSQPRVLCRKRGGLVLSWSCLDASCVSASFLIQSRNSSSIKWRYLGLTRENFSEITDLQLGSRFQFRVAPLTHHGPILPSSSDWIEIESIPSRLSAPGVVNVSDFALENSLVKAVARWNASKELPCSYEIFWFPSSRNNYALAASQKVVLPQHNLSSVLLGLLFNTNYTVRITPLDEESAKRESVETWFLTPTCLDLTHDNFDICAPSKPLNLTASLNSTNILLKWLPPSARSPSSSLRNAVLGYRIFVMVNGSKYIDFKAVTNDTLNASFPLLKGGVDDSYSFEVSAVSRGGIGSAAFAEIKTKKSSVSLDISKEETSWHVYIILALCVFCLVVLLFVIIKCTKNFPKRKQKGGYPTGVADVHTSMLPLLVPLDKVRLTDFLGQGAFGVVHKGIYSWNKSEEEVAVKVLPADSDTRRHLLNEVEMLHLVGRHEKVVGLVGFSFDIEKIFLILEYCPMGDVRSYLLEKKPVIKRMKSLPSLPPSVQSEMSRQKLQLGKRMCLYIHQVAQGMEYISSLKLIHRDLAARNVLMVDRDRVKIADFGLSRDVYETSFYLGKQQVRLPIKWMPPEAIEKHKFSTKSDVWSFGVFMWEVFRLGEEPYRGVSNDRILQLIKEGHRLEWPHCWVQWYHLMHECWSINPRSRPTFREIAKRVMDIIDKMYHYTVFF